MEFSPLHEAGLQPPFSSVDRLNKELAAHKDSRLYVDSLFEKFAGSRSFALLKNVAEIIYPTYDELEPHMQSGSFNAFIQGALVGLKVSADMLGKNHDDILASGIEYFTVDMGIKSIETEDCLNATLNRPFARAIEYLGDMAYLEKEEFQPVIEVIASQICPNDEDISRFYCGFGFVLGTTEIAVERIKLGS